MKTVQNPSAPSGFYVTIVTSAGSTTKKVDGDVLTVGRAENCDLTINQDTLSRRHLTVSLRDGFCWVEDHGSSNGTFVSGRRIQPHTPVRLKPDDQVSMGQAGARLSFSIEPAMRSEAPPPLTEEDPNTIVTSTNASRQQKRAVLQAPPSVPKKEVNEQVEQMLQEAQKKASALIQNAEVEAEQRVEDIYRRAHEAQAKAEESYQRKMNEAFRSAEEVFQKSQAEAQALLEKARHHSLEIRQQAENFVTDLRRRTDADCERMLEDAQETSRELKEQRLLEAEELIKKREEETLAAAHETINLRLARFEEDLELKAKRERENLDKELIERRAEVDALKSDIQHYRELQQSEGQQLQTIRTELKNRKEDFDLIERAVADSREVEAHLKTEISRLGGERSDLSSQVKELQGLLTGLKREVTSERQKSEALLAQMRAGFEEEKAKLTKQEESHLENLKREANRQVLSLERQFMEELQHKKDGLSRELVLLMETCIRETSERRNFEDLQKQIAAAIDKNISVLAESHKAKEKQESFLALKRGQRFTSGLIGAALGMGALFAFNSAYHILQSGESPLQKKVEEAQEMQRQDLEQRKFNPPQTRDFKSTYVDNVVYTEGFVSIYTSDGFQKELLRDLAPYMLKTWKTDEEKVIELLGISSALVKTLAEKKQNIHPDFVQSGLEKMKELEGDSAKRMRELLGSQVRVESFKKFEREFYETHREPAAVNPVSRSQQP